MAGYCTVADVAALTQPTDGYKAVSDGRGQPTISQVQEFVDMIGDEITLAIQRAGYTIPIVSPVALTWLSMVNAFGAGSLAALTLAHHNTDTDPLHETLWDKYTARKNEILTGTAPLGTVNQDSNRPASLWTTKTAAGSDPGVSDIQPMVRRDTQF